MMSAKVTIQFFTLIIYILIIIAFNKARRKYSGGKIGDVINLIMITVALLFVADYLQLFQGLIQENIITTLQVLFRTVALSFLAYGGNRIASK